MLEMHVKDIVDLVGLSDPDIDRHMGGMCKSVNATWRAVETSELMLRTVDGLPQTNIWSVPVIGTCPNCEGDDDEYDILSGEFFGTVQHQSGHSRVCWDPGATLDTKNRRTDCGSATEKVVLCVDTHDSVWGNITTFDQMTQFTYGQTFSHSQSIDLAYKGAGMAYQNAARAGAVATNVRLGNIVPQLNGGQLPGGFR